MKVHKIFHTCYLVEAEGHFGLIDPALVFPVFSAYVPRDGVVLDLDVLLGRRFDFVFISHAHRDHFDPFTLVRLPRDTLIVHGTPAVELPGYFDALGFTNQRAVAPWDTLRVGPFELMPIPTHITATETGLAVRAGGASFANLIDVHTTEEIHREYVAHWGRPTLLAPITLPSNEHRITNAVTCQSKSHGQLRELARPNRAFGAGHAILSGHDLALPFAPWLNHRLFSNSVDEHLAAFRAEEVAPVVEFGRAGHWWRLTSAGVTENGPTTPGVALTGTVYNGTFDLTSPVPPFADRRVYPAEVDLERQARDFEVNLLKVVLKTSGVEREKLREIGQWRYQIHHPDGISFDAVLDVRGPRPTWSDTGGSVGATILLTASGLAALTQLLISHHGLRMNDQLRSDLPPGYANYEPTRRYPNPYAHDVASMERALAGQAPWPQPYLP